MIGECFLRNFGVAVAWVALASPSVCAQARVIEVLADKDSRYKIAGQRTPEITVKAGEPLLLRLTARRGKSWNRWLFTFNFRKSPPPLAQIFPSASAVIPCVPTTPGP